MHIYSKRLLGGRGASLRRRAGLRSFSLVEVVIAIAVAAFGLVSILGLMFYASQTVQQSDKYARLSAVTSQALASVQSQTFGSSPYGEEAAFNGIGVAGNAAILTKYMQTNCYTFEGVQTNIPAASIAAAGSAYYYYLVTVTDATPLTSPNSRSTYPYYFNGQQIMEPVLITIKWPNPAFTSTNIIVTSILNYGTL